MVRAAVLAVCLLAPSTASAQTVDWRKAGGDLFVGVASED